MKMGDVQQSKKELGINAVELMPIFEFDETMNSRTVDGKQLLECWGYNTVSFFAPNSSYSSGHPQTASCFCMRYGSDPYTLYKCRRNGHPERCPHRQSLYYETKCYRICRQGILKTAQIPRYEVNFCRYNSPTLLHMVFFLMIYPISMILLGFCSSS